MSLPPFQLLLDRHERDVRRLLIALVGVQEADDLAQETWLAALRAYPRLATGANLRGWVLTIAHRKALDHFRSRPRLPMPSASIPEAIQEDPPSGGAVWNSVRALPEKQRGAVTLRFLLDLGYDEIAVALECSQDAARRSVHEGLKRLREEYPHAV